MQKVLPLFLALLTLSFGADHAAAQELEAEVLPSEEPEVSTEDIRKALQEMLDEESGDGQEARTTADPDISTGALELLLEPLTQGELQHEIAGWFDLLRAAVTDLAAEELVLFESIEAAEEAQEDASVTKEMSPEQKALVAKIAELREIRTLRADRLRVVLAAFEAKGGDAGDVQEIRDYLSDVGGVKVDTRNLRTAWMTLLEWAKAEDGGIRFARHLAQVIGSTLVGALLGWLISLLVSTGLKRTEISSRLMRDFLKRWIARGGALIGLLVGLSAIGTNMTPILAGLGAVGFILAFALQDTIGNFASGLLILFQRPFDTGDEIEAAGMVGIVERVSLFSTHLSTEENRKVIVPNNMIWEDVIVNSTGADTRRLSIEVEVDSSDHSLDESEAILLDVMRNHPQVLDKPEPSLTLSAMGADSMTFTCWPWVRTDERDRLRWDLIARFGRELSMVQGTTKSGS